MGNIQWTADQKKIIEKRGSNILVSAAAGSGKTAVLVERIFQRIADKSNPVDADRFVVVTFTKAAAAQMRERLRNRLEEALEEEPENRHLQRQIPLLSSSHISTVHSFCGYVIQNYFHRIGLDPSYRQGTENELEMIRKEVMNTLLEEEYERGQEDFTALAGLHSLNRHDKPLEDRILTIYEQAMSQPFPADWLNRMRDVFKTRTVEEWKKTEFCRELMNYMGQVVGGVIGEFEELIAICGEPDGPYLYEENLQKIIEMLRPLQSECDYERAKEIWDNLTFPRLPSKKDDTINHEKREMVKKRRDDCKKTLVRWQTTFFSQSIGEHIGDLHRMGETIQTLIRLTEKYKEYYTREKRDRNIVDFNDLEQLALSILLERDEGSGKYVRSSAAKELSEYFEEIMIDEYQDSNRVQDTLLSAVCKQDEEGKTKNMFMVGDVKQSIYRFRNACPELFAHKLENYPRDCRIDLHQNFRSREIVLAGCNQVFDRIMHRDIGGVEYDEAARLQTGRTFEKTNCPIADSADVYVIMGKDSSAEEEGRLAAIRIQEMVKGESPLYIQDKDTLRPVSYRDIVILARGTKNVGQVYFNMLAEAGVPVVMERTRGFFDTREIQLMTQMLQVIDNPREDLPLAGVLCSPMFGWSEDELAVVRSGSRDTDLYDSLLGCRREELRDKIDSFIDFVNLLREKTSYATVEELIQDIYEKTGIYDLVRMMRDGSQRTANMDFLTEQAREFDRSTYHGLHAFVQYIRRIKEQQESIGEVNIIGEEEDVVRIMTMHKSKGLEFPVCLLLGMGQKLGGRSDSYLTIHPELGIACAIEDAQTRTKKETIYQNILKNRNFMEDRGEEMRILYVAMTRAQEKLIMIGRANEIGAGSVDFFGRSQMKSYLDMVLPAALSDSEHFQVIPVERDELKPGVVSEKIQEKIEMEALNNFDTSVVYHMELHERMEELASEEWQNIEPLPVKVSVSDLKAESMEEQDFANFTILSHDGEEEDEPVPAFMKDQDERTRGSRGASYGTVWHQVLATIDFDKTDDERQIRGAIDELVQEGKLREEEKEVLNIKSLYRFFSSPLGQKMRLAAAGGKLHREQPFVMQKPAFELFPDREEKDTVLVQGIMDAYFETEDGIVLLDYKTDSLKEGEESVLVERYRTQLKLYSEALGNMLGRPVKRCVLYSFSLGKEVEVL